MSWKIYYGDGSTYCDLDGPPELAPGRNVQVVAQWHQECGRQYLHSHDYYYWRPEQGRWVANSDRSGWALWDYLQEPGFKVVKFGRDIPREDYFVICSQAHTDTYLAAKTAVLPDEIELPHSKVA